MGARHRIPELTAQGRAAAAALRGAVAGTVSTSPLRRWLYSTDASIYRVVPDVVLEAASVADLHAAAAIAAEHGVPLVVRGAATSVAGQAVGPGIAVDCFKLDRILAIDPEARTARVEPGVIQASLNRAAAAFGLEFGPDTSTVDQATIGGMVGNNSSGSRSIVYGETKDKIVRVDAVTVGGSALVFGQCRGDDLASGLAGAGAAAAGAALAEVRGRYRRPIAEDSPQTRRCTTGYNLRELLEPSPNLGKLLAGSEGTLALFAEIEVTLDPLPAARTGAALTFATLRAALEANAAILETGPSAVELLDLDPLRAAPNLAAFGRLAPLMAGEERALLTVEYQGSADEARAGLGRLRALAGDLGATAVEWLEDPAALAEAGALRRAVVPLLMGAPGADRPVPFVEDTAVAPECLARLRATTSSISWRPQARAPRSRGTPRPAACTSGRCSTSSRRPGCAAWRRWRRPSCAWSSSTTARSPASTASGARAAGPCPVCSARTCMRPWSPSRTPSTRAVFWGRASSSTAPPWPSLCATAPTTAATAPGRRGSRTPQRAASTSLWRSASARASARSSPGPCVRPPRPVAARRSRRAPGPTPCRACSAAPCRWPPSAPTSSARCSARASPAKPARRSARPAWTWPPSRRSGSPRSAPGRGYRPWRAASASSAVSRRWRRRGRRS